MSEAALNAMAQQLVDLTLNKTKYDVWDLQWYTESPFWRRTNMKFSRTYKQIPDYEIGDMKHGLSLKDILEQSENLIQNLKEYKKTASADEMNRVNYLIENTENLHFRSRQLLGEKFSFDETTMGLYCVKAPEYDYKNFDDILEEMKQAMPGTGPIGQRIEDFRNAIMVPPQHLLKVISGTTDEFHDIAVKNMTVTGNSKPRVRVRELPNPNMVFISILFGYDYNHLEYERNFNLLYPWSVEKVMEYVGHEMEPGHLTCFEKRTQTFIDTCWPEMSVISQFSTGNSVGEGTARHAVSMSFDNSMEKMVDFEREFIFKPSGMNLAYVELMPLWHKYCEIAGYGKLEASRHDWNGTWTKEEGAAFLEKYGFAAPGKGLEVVAGFAGDDDGHYVAHDYSRDLVREYFSSMTTDVKEQWALYEKLCCSHVTLSGIKDKSFRVE